MVFRIARYWTVFGARWIQSPSLTLFYKTNFTTVLSFTLGVSKLVARLYVLQLIFHKKFLTFLRASSTTQFSLLVFCRVYSISWCTQLTKPSVTLRCPSHCYFSSVRSKYSRQHFVLKYPQLLLKKREVGRSHQAKDSVQCRIFMNTAINLVVS